MMEWPETSLDYRCNLHFSVLQRGLVDPNSVHSNLSLIQGKEFGEFGRVRANNDEDNAG